MKRALLFIPALLACIGAQADEVPSVTPYRPSVSTPAALSAPGWLEVEAGVQRSNAEDPRRRDTVPYTLKLAFTPDWGIRVGGDAFVHQQDAAGTSERGIGDTSIVLKRRFAVNDANAFGLEAGVKLPTARAGIGSEHTDAGLNGIFSSDFAPKWHVDVNLTATHLGGTPAGESAWQKGWASAFSRNLDEHWSAQAELSGTWRGGADRTTQALVAAAYAVSPAIVIDAGVSKGLNTASGGWSVFSGITFLAAKVF
ncbi:transporter [Ramlibacter sp. G-1-2-2]|uniref:Transporter n=1 Tax=Ramlibacter agri TaxID=2728837 RepID=A0A848H361_9BURK|nr:transporter [Ramlibacter agri]NML43123.1 transporter [Ramlibacter agri]